MDIEELINLQRQGRQDLLMEQLPQLSIEDELYVPKLFECLLALVNVRELDRLWNILQDLPELPPVYANLAQVLVVHVTYARGEKIDYDPEDLQEVDTSQLSDLDLRYHGMTLKYTYRTSKQLSEERKEIFAQFEVCRSEYFLLLEYEHIRYRDRWLSKEFTDMIQDYEKLRERSLVQKYYSLALRYQNLLHLSYRPIAKGDPDIINKILREMDRMLEFIDHISPSDYWVVPVIEHKTRFLGTLNRNAEAELFLDTTLPRLSSTDSRYLRSTNHIRGRFYYWLKRWDRAIHYLELGLEEDKSVLIQSEMLRLLGVSYYYQGKIKDAMTIISRHKDLLTLHGRSTFGLELNEAELNLKIGRYDHAATIYEQHLKRYDKEDLQVNEIKKLLYILKCYVIALINLDRLEEAQQQFDRMEDMISTADFHVSTSNIQDHSIAKGLLLSHGSRARHKIQALEIFEDLYGQKGGNEENRRLIMINYCSLLFLELEKFGEQEVFDMVKQVVGEILELGVRQSSTILQLQALLFRAKLEQIEQNFDEVENLYIQAKQVARENKLLMHLVTSAEEEYLDKLQEMKSLASHSHDLKDRINMMEIKNYFKEAKAMVDSAE